jgi:dihydroneopterin aldolase
MLRGALRGAARRAFCSWAPSGGDRVLLRGLLFHGYHGVLPEERTLGQKFAVDVALSVDLRAAGASDDLQDTISYAAVYECAAPAHCAAARLVAF